MINKLYKMRGYIPDELIDESPYGLCLEERKEKVIVLEFKTKEVDSDDLFSKKRNEFEFIGSHPETYSREKNESKYFFKKVPARGSSEFPTVFMSKKDFTKNANKFINIIKKNNKLITLVEAFEYGCFKIKKELYAHLKNSKDLWILTFTLDGKYIGDLDCFNDIRDELKENLCAPYYTLSNKTIRPQDKTCSICFKDKQEVWGYVSTFNFYTAKTEFAPIAGGFDKSESWKNYPVCPECAVKLKETKTVIEKYMQYYFCGFSYFLIPEFINDYESNSKIMEIFLDKESLAGKFSLKDKVRNTLSDTEGEILDILQDSDNRVNYTMFFFERNNQEFKILLTIEGIYPSQFKEIFTAKDEAENSYIFKNLENKKEKKLYDLQFKFDFVKEFLPVKNKIYGDFSKYFLDIMRSVLLKKRVDYAFIMHRIAETVRRKFAHEELYNISILKMILTLKFFSRLKIIDMNINHKEKEIVVDKKYQDFFIDHSEFFDCSSKKSIFLEGVLCQKLLNWQWKERGATPFRNKLNSLKMNPKIIRKLLPEIIEKLEQYGRNYYRSLEETISLLLLEAKLDKLSNDEISFYFVMGMNLVKEFFKLEDEKELELEEN